jgi:hypothetical protein
MGFFEGLETEKYDRQYTDRELTRRIVDYFKQQRTRMIIIIVLVVAISVVGAALPLVVAWVVGVIAGQPDPSLQAILLVGVGTPAGSGIQLPIVATGTFSSVSRFTERNVPAASSHMCLRIAATAFSIRALRRAIHEML